VKILVTGAGGFLGTEMVRQAQAARHTVRAMIRNPAHRAQLPLAPGQAVVCDLAEPGDLAGVMTGIEGVVHCAAVTSAGGGDAERSRRVNVEGTRRLLAAARQAGVARWVQISSMSAHPGSTSVYGRTKLAADALLRQGPAEPPAWTILRPSLIYGPGRQGLAAKTLALARRLPVVPMIGSGRERLRPVYVADVAQGALRCLELNVTKGKTYILGGADEITLDDFLRRLLASAGLNRPVLHLPPPLCMLLARVLAKVLKDPPITVDNVLGVREMQPTDHAPAIQEWGWSPIGLDEGLRRTFA
jgi:NADH dehydrogenase